LASSDFMALSPPIAKSSARLRCCVRTLKLRTVTGKLIVTPPRRGDTPDFT